MSTTEIKEKQTSIEEEIHFLMRKIERVRAMKKRSYMSEESCDREIALYDSIISRLIGLVRTTKMMKVNYEELLKIYEL